VTATVNRSSVYYFDHGRMRGIGFDPSGEAELPAASEGDSARFAPWSSHLDGAGWARVGGQRALVLDSLSIDTCGPTQRSTLIRIAEAAGARCIWSDFTWLHDSLTQAHAWADIADDLAFLAQKPLVPEFQEQAETCWRGLRQDFPAYTEAGTEDAVWRAWSSGGRIILRHKPTGNEVPIAALATSLPSGLRRFIDHLAFQCLPELSLGSPDARSPVEVEAFLDRVEDALEWCRQPTSDAWKLIGPTLRTNYGTASNPWHGLMDLLQDLEARNPVPGEILHDALLRCRSLIGQAQWNMTAILSVRDQRILEAAHGKARPKRAARKKPRAAPRKKKAMGPPPAASAGRRPGEHHA
jgi:hypothetical protein